MCSCSIVFRYRIANDLIQHDYYYYYYYYYYTSLRATISMAVSLQIFAYVCASCVPGVL